MTVKPTVPTKETKKAYFYEYTGNDAVDLSDLVLTKKKPLNVTLDNNSDPAASKTFKSSQYYNETITVSSGAYTMHLYGSNSNKTVKLGNTKDNDVSVSNSGKNKITAGDGGNTFRMHHTYSNNTITSGKGRDFYYLTGGITKITDKGGNDYYDISGGMNTVVDKGGDNHFVFGGNYNFGKYTTGSGSDTFDITLSNVEGEFSINSGDGKDYLNIYNDLGNKNNLIINADLGKGDDKVVVDYVTYGDVPESEKHYGDVSTLNLKTGKGNDEVYIYAGKINNIDTGDGNDTIAVAVMHDATVSTIKAGKGNDEITVNKGINTIYGEADADTINLAGGTNTVYGGGDNINATVSDAVNTIYASSDTINLISGDNTIYTSKGGNTINISSNTLGTANKTNSINLAKGNNTVYANSDKSGNIVEAEVNISAGKNTIILDGYSALSIYSSDKLKTAQTINIKGHAFASTQLGKGADVITDSSDKDVANGWMMQAGAGNDKFYISNGSNKQLYGQDGNDYFEITSGNSHVAYGGFGKDTFVVSGGDSHTIYGNGGNDTITVSGGDSRQIYGDEGNDTITLDGGDSNGIYAGEGNDTITIKGDNTNTIINAYDGDDVINLEKGQSSVTAGDGNDVINIKGGTHTVNGNSGDDIYNLNMTSKDDFVEITDGTGKNKINVSRNYNGLTRAYDFTGSNDILSFDKNYKMTNSSNIKDGSLNTTDSSITIYSNYTKSSQSFNMAGIYLVKNVKDEISNNTFKDHSIIVDSTIETFSFGGKNYTLDLNALKQDLASWFSTHDAAYTDSASVFANEKTAGDIQSLMAVYTEHTADCFVK